MKRVRPALLAWLVFVLLHGLLTLGTWDVIDQEELEFGNLPLAMLDGELDAVGRLRTIAREGSQVLLAPFFAALFALLGPTLLTLKIGNVLGCGVWAAAWGSVARRLLPQLPVWLVFGVFVLPIPFVQRSSVAAISIHTHLGASTLHALILLCVLGAVRGERRSAWLVAAGLLTAVAIFFSLTVLPLLPGVLFLVWRIGGIRGALSWGLAALPGLLAQASTLGSGYGDAGDVGGYVRDRVILDPTSLDPANLLRAAQYAPGFASSSFDATGFLTYDGRGWIYSALLLGSFAHSLRRRSSSDVPGLGWSLLISAACFTPLLMLGRAAVDGGLFDGPRYALPLLGMATIAGLRGAGRGSVWLLAAHALGFVLLFRPAVFPAPWSEVLGAEPWLDRRPQAADFQFDGGERAARYALWTGMRLVPDHGAPASWAEASAMRDRQGFEGVAEEEFWVGVGYSLEVWTDGLAAAADLFAQAPGELQAQLWEGAAMAWRCAEPDALHRAAGPWFINAIWRGRGRAELFCRERRSGSPWDPEGRRPPAFFEGVERFWERDLGAGSQADLEFLRGVRMFAIFDLREEARTGGSR